MINHITVRGIIAGAAILAAFFFVLAGNSRAHQAPRGWHYDMECCSDFDCAPIPTKDVKPAADGSYVLSTGEVIPATKLKRSQDEDYHLCRSPHTGTIFCLYVPHSGA